MFFYTYVIQSTKDRKLYIGFTGDLRIRIEEHNTGRVVATAERRPFRLVYYEACLDKAAAIKREKFLKTGFGRRFLKQRLQLDQLPIVLGG